MRKMLFTLLLLLCVCAHAQRVDKPGEPYDFYCIVIYGNWSKAYVLMPNYDDYQALMQEDGKKISFRHTAEMITYMSKRGWNLLESTLDDGKPAHDISRFTII